MIAGSRILFETLVRSVRHNLFLKFPDGHGNAKIYQILIVVNMIPEIEFYTNVSSCVHRKLDFADTYIIYTHSTDDDSDGHELPSLLLHSCTSKLTLPVFVTKEVNIIVWLFYLPQAQKMSLFKFSKLLFWLNYSLLRFYFEFRILTLFFFFSPNVIIASADGCCWEKYSWNSVGWSGWQYLSVLLAMLEGIGPDYPVIFRERGDHDAF